MRQFTLMRFSTVLTALTLILVIATVAPARAQSAATTQALSRALACLDRGDPAAARTVLAALPADLPSDPLTLSTRGATELASGQRIAAESLFRQALELAPQHFPALWGLSLCLLRDRRADEAAPVVARAAAIMPADPGVLTLQSYTALMLDRLPDAASSGSAAWRAGGRSPFLLGILTVLHDDNGFPDQALAFGHDAARAYDRMDFLARARGIALPLPMIETPRAASAAAPRLRTELERAPAPARPVTITTPAPHVVLRGPTPVQASCATASAVAYVQLFADDALCGIATEMPYRWLWNADGVPPGPHTLRVAAFSPERLLIGEEAISILTTGGRVDEDAPPAQHQRVAEALVAVMTPAPATADLFARMGRLYRRQGDVEQAIAAYEKAAAIDPDADGVLAALAGLYATRGASGLSDDGNIWSGPPTGQKRVALTFDDGPNPLYTPAILAMLRPYRARATFFLVGKMVQKYPHLARQLADEGHELANHSYTHPNLTRLTPRQLIAEALRARTIITEVTGRHTDLFRPPGGNIDAEVTRQLRALDYHIAYWSINAGETKALPPDQQAARILARVRDGSILLLHNGPVDGTMNILPTLLAELTRRGYTCVTVSELMRE